MKYTLKYAKTFGVVTKGNSKIHGSTFSTSPFACNVGSKLVNVEGSTCSKCYAIKLAKVYPSAKQSWENNLKLWVKSLDENPMDWVNSIAHQIKNESNRKKKAGIRGAGLHRWFAAGDIPNVQALRAIVLVAKKTPDIRHWLPTREQGIVAKYLATNPDGFPDNLTVRVSAAMVDGSPLEKFPCTSTVHKDKPAVGFECPAYKNGGSCGDCTACWTPSVKNISYKIH